MERPICYYIGRWEKRCGKSNTFCFVAQTSTLKLAQAVAAVTHREILSDDDPRAEDCEWVWDYDDGITDVMVHEDGEDGKSPGQSDGSDRGGGEDRGEKVNYETQEFD